MNLLAPLGLLAGLLAIPIILMYMLRLRRREVMISSTYLWSQVLQDTEANTPWQRLRRNLLLILQLLILALLAFGLARPFVTVEAISAGQVTLLLDASASMNATDLNGSSRWDAAKAEALAIVQTLGAGDRMTVIRVAGVPEVLAATTDDKSALRNAINTAVPSLAEADWTAALNLAVASGTSAEDFTIVLISDGGLPSDAGLQGLRGTVRYIPVGESAQNVAITALATDRLPGQSAQLYAEITNYGDLPAEITFALRVDGERFESINLSVPAGGALPLVSSALPDDFSTLEAHITQRVNAVAEDYLAEDNVAYAVAEGSTDARVLLVTDGSVFLEQAFRSLPGLRTTRTDGATGIPDGYDLYVFDGAIPDLQDFPPQGDLLFINPQANTPFFSLGAVVDFTQAESLALRLTEEGESRLPYVAVADLRFQRAQGLGGVDWAEALITANDTPLLLAGEISGRQIAILPFNLNESNLPLDISWIILMADLVTWYDLNTRIPLPDSIHVGETLTIRPPLDADAVRITTPTGDAQTLDILSESLIYADTGQTGLYLLEVLRNGQIRVEQPFAVNLFSPMESAIAPVPPDALTIQGVAVNDSLTEELGQRELWPFVVGAALLILLIEWIAYHRRLRVPTLFRPIPPRPVAATG